jgi:hypothetical protein
MSPTLGPASLLDTFESLDDATKNALADIKTPLHLGLASLYLAKEKAARSSLTAEHIVACLEAAGVAVQREQITKAFSRAGNRISRSIVDNEIHYKLMTSGQREIEPIATKGTIQLFHIEGQKPRTARKVVSELIGTLSGEIRVCDPYYGERSLDVLDQMPSGSTVKFLTCKTSEKVPALSRAISDYKREHPTCEIRQLAPPNTLHDRFILTDSTLLILGHGIKDIGSKESFVISLSEKLVPGIISSLKSTFDANWASARAL